MDHLPVGDGVSASYALPECSWEVTGRQGDRTDHLVLAVRGVVSSPPADGPLHRVLRSQLLDHGRVVVDLSAATVPWGPAVQVFPSVLADAGGWPLARLVLAGADPLTARILRASRVPLTVPVATTLAEARILLDTRPPRVARDQEIPYHPKAPTLAHWAMASACEDWEIHDGLSDAAATVAAELVSNAVDHAGTPCVLHLALDHRRLQVAVRDSRPVSERRPQITVAGERGFGLLIVQGLSRGWGVTPHTGGKTVWAILDAEHDPLS